MTKMGYWTDYNNADDRVVFAAYESDNFAGFAGCKPEDDIAGCLLLGSLRISPDNRGKGIGSALVKRCLEYAKSNGYTSMTINIINGNEKAKGLYMKLGARHHRCFDDILSTGEIAPSEKFIWK